MSSFSTFNLANFLAGEVDTDVTQRVALLRQDDSPLLAMMLASGRVAESNTRDFKWHDQGMPNLRTAINNGGSAYTSGTTSLVVDDGTVFAANDVILFEATDEVGLVTAVSTNTLTVVRGLGAVVAAHANSVADDAAVRNIGPAGVQSADVAAAVMRAKTQYTNGLQTFRKAVSISGFSNREGTKTESERGRQRLVKFNEFQRLIEQSLLFGQYDSDVAATGGLTTTTAGILSAIDQVLGSVGNITQAVLDQFALDYAFLYGGSVKTLMCGPTAYRFINALYKSQVNLTPGEVSAGIRVRRIMTAGGEFELVKNLAMTGKYAGYAISIDPEALELKHGKADAPKIVSGLPHLRTDLESKGVDGHTDEWWAELGLKYGSPDQHAVMTGITGSA